MHPGSEPVYEHESLSNSGQVFPYAYSYGSRGVHMKRRGYLKPWLFGIIAGCMIVLFEVFFNFYPPSAYSFCLTCHTRDLVNQAVNLLFHTNFQSALISRRVVESTSFFVIIGAFVAARRHGEVRLQKSTHPLLYFFAGFIVMLLGILIFGCPTRIAVRVGYGDLYGIIAFAGMVFGVWIGTLLMKRVSRRPI